MIRDAEEKGLLKEDTIIVEPTSGNQGIGLALVGAVRGYHTRIIMPDSVSEERRKLMKHYGAEVVLIHDAGNIGECIEECLNTALKMAEEDPGSSCPSSLRTRRTRRCTGRRRRSRSWSRRTARSTDSVPASEPAEPSPASARCSKRRIPTWRSGRWSRSMRPSSRADPSAPIFRWASATA